MPSATGANILALDNYDSFTFTLVDYLRTLGADVTVRRNDVIDAREALAGPFDGYLISPGPGRPQEAGASGNRYLILQNFFGELRRLTGGKPK